MNRAAVVAAFLLFLCAACGGQSKPIDPNSDAATGFSSEVHANAAHLAGEDGVTSESGIVVYEVSLYRWQSSCEEGDSAAGEIDAAEMDLQRHGIEMTRLKLMRTVANSSFTSEHENCAGDLAAYLVLKER